MSSPFAVFRKHQRAMMVVIGVMCMLAFTVLGSVQMGLQGTRIAENEVVATSTFGDFTRPELNTMRYRRDLVKRFLVAAMMQTVEPEMQMFVLPQIGQAVANLIGPTTDSAIVETHILASKAEKMGVVVSDQAVTDFLFEITNNSVSGEQFQAALATAGPGGQRASKSSLYEAMRTEILASRLRELFLRGLQATPAERWDYFLQLQRRAKVEYAAITSEELVGEVPDPSESVLKSFFDKYRNDEAVPGSPVPGFKVPHKAVFQFFRADWEHFYKPELVNDEAVAAHYEKHKDERYRYRAGQEVDEERPKLKIPGQDETKDDEAAKPAAEKADEAKSDKSPAQDEKQEKPSPEKAKSDTSPAEPKKDEPNKNESSDASDAAPLIFDGDQLAQVDPGSSPTPPTGESSDTATPAANAVSTPAAEAATEAPSGPAMLAPANSTSTESSEPDVSATAPPTLSLRYVLPTDVLAGPNPLYEPLWSVEEAIRTELAVGEAEAAIKKIFDRLEEPLRKYSNAWAAAKNQDAEDAALPTPPDFEALAKPYEGISAAQTPLVSALELSHMQGFGQSSYSDRRVSDFWLSVAQLFQVLRSQDLDNNRYLFWKTKDVPTHVPELADVRTEVEQTWKLFQARDLVRQRGDALAAKVRGSDKSLLESLAGEKGLEFGETGFFSWLTRGSARQTDMAQPARLSEVPGVEEVGDEFMQTVFDLDPGEAGFAMNEPQTVGYIVRVVDTEPAAVTLREMFYIEETRRSFQYAAGRSQKKWYDEWLASQLAAAKLVWKQPPNDETERF